MSNSNIDKLFHDKLAMIEAQPSIEAWEKINDRIRNKKSTSKFLTLAIAAALVLIMTSTLIWVDFQNKADVTISENQITPGIDSIDPIKEPEIRNLPAVKSEETRETGIKENIKIEPRISGSQLVSNENIKIDDTIIEQYQYAQVVDMLNLKKQGPGFNHDFVQFKPDFKYLPVDKNDLLLPDDEPGIKKAYDFAMRVKNGEESLLNLRKAKEDLFAMAKNIKLNQILTD